MCGDDANTVRCCSEVGQGREAGQAGVSVSGSGGRVDRVCGMNVRVEQGGWKGSRADGRGRLAEERAHQKNMPEISRHSICSLARNCGLIVL